MNTQYVSKSNDHNFQKFTSMLSIHRSERTDVLLAICWSRLPGAEGYAPSCRDLVGPRVTHKGSPTGGPGDTAL